MERTSDVSNLKSTFVFLVLHCEFTAATVLYQSPFTLENYIMVAVRVLVIIPKVEEK